MHKKLIFLTLLTNYAMAETINYTCENLLFSRDSIEPEWSASLNIDFKTGTFHWFKVNNDNHTGLTYQRELIPIYNSLYKSRPEDASIIAVYSKGMGTQEFQTSYLVAVFGKTGGVKAGDVILVSPPKNKDNYYCYRKGSQKDKVMTKFRREHNSRITE